MRTKNFNWIFKITILLIVVMGLSTCNTSQKATSSQKSFIIPKKIVKAEDLPKELQESAEQSEVHYVQLYPDEKPAGEMPQVTNTEPMEEPATLANEKTELEKHVDDVVKNIVENRTRPIFYHIVSGSFRNKLYADMFAEYLKNIGYGNTYVRFFDNGFNRVIVQRYNNEVEARQYLQGYRNDNPLYADAWLYYNKNISDDPMAFISN